MGHSQCGGCAHALNVVTKNRDLCVAMHGEGGVPSTVDRWCFTMKEAVCGVIDKFDPQIRGRQLELENVRMSVRRVSEYPWVKDAVKAGTLQVRGAFFQVFDGRLFVLGTDDHVIFTDLAELLDATRKTGLPRRPPCPSPPSGSQRPRSHPSEHKRTTRRRRGRVCLTESSVEGELMCMCHTGGI